MVPLSDGVYPYKPVWGGGGTSPGSWSKSRENEGTERDIQGVGWDMSIPLRLFLVLGGNGSLFPQTSTWYLPPVDLGIEKLRRSAWKYVLSVEAPKEPQPLWNKNAGGMKEYQCLSSENLNQRKQRWQEERINLLSFIDNMQRSIVLFNVVT